MVGNNYDEALASAEYTETTENKHKDRKIPDGKGDGLYLRFAYGLYWSCLHFSLALRLHTI